MSRRAAVSVVSKGHYGIRVWLTTDDVQRLGVRADALDVRLRARGPSSPRSKPVSGD